MIVKAGYRWATIAVVLVVIIGVLPATGSVIPSDTDFRWTAQQGEEWSEKAKDTQSDVPYWLTGTDHGQLYVPNAAMPLVKTVWLELTFKDEASRGAAMSLPTFVEAIVPPGSTSTNAWAAIDPDDPLVVAWTWTITPQPAWEILDLSNSIWDLSPLGGDAPVQKIEVASRCVPEPATLVIWSLLGAMGIAVSRWRRPRR